MKIVYVIDQLDCGGAEQQLVSLATGLHGRGHEVHVIIIYNRAELRDELTSAGVPLSVAGKRGKYDLTTVWRLRRLIDSIGPDLVHAYLPAASLLTPLTRWLGINVPVLQSERNINDWRSGVRLWADMWARRYVDHITCNAEAIKTHLVRVERVPPEKITVIYNGLRADRRTRPADRSITAAADRINAPRGARIIVCVANFNERKQHGLLLEAFARARAAHPDLFLLLIGTGSLEHDVRTRIEKLQLSSACRILTDVVNPLPFLCASQIAVLTSRIEGCSNALLEAMAMGLPVIASATGGTPEVIQHGQGGLVCPVGDAEAFANALRRLVSDPQLSHRMGAFNARRVVEHFTDDRMIELTLALYYRVLKSGPLPDSRPRKLTEAPVFDKR